LPVRGHRPDFARGIVYPRRNHTFQREPLPKVLDAVRPLVLPLTIDAIRLDSPGWLQVIGNVNPLKIMADSISKWRAEDNKRLKIRSMKTLEREKLTKGWFLEQERMHRQFTLDVLNQIPESARTNAAERLAEIAEHIIRPSIKMLQKLSKDERFENAKLIDPGTPLPEGMTGGEESPPTVN
jgi:hypothetical protein